MHEEEVNQSIQDKQQKNNRPVQNIMIIRNNWSCAFIHLLASSKMSGSCLASFSLATSAIGPKMTTGLKNPAAQKQDSCVGLPSVSTVLQ